jgi:hypothetical protein
VEQKHDLTALAKSQIPKTNCPSPQTIRTALMELHVIKQNTSHFQLASCIYHLFQLRCLPVGQFRFLIRTWMAFECKITHVFIVQVYKRRCFFVQRSGE